MAASYSGETYGPGRNCLGCGRFLQKNRCAWHDNPKCREKALAKPIVVLTDKQKKALRRKLLRSLERVGK